MIKLASVFRSFLGNHKYYPLIFLILCVLSYGLLIPFMGFFMDDWYVTWFKHVFGSMDLIRYFNFDRPLMGYFYIIANFLLGGSERPIVWHIFAIIIRWLVVVSLWQMLNSIWENSRQQNTLVALLALVFPGFTQQWISVSYSFHLTCLAGFFFSITLMLKAIRKAKQFNFYYICSLLIMAYVIPASEFFIGLELIRPIILWFEFSQKEGNNIYRIKKVIKYSFPYFVILMIYLVWRIFFFRSSQHLLSIDTWMEDGLAAGIIRSGLYIYQSIIEATVNSWGKAFNLASFPSKGVISSLISGLVLLVLIFLIIWFRSGKANHENTRQTNLWRKQAPILGIISMVFATIPFWSAYLPINDMYPNDRFLLAFLFGSCLITIWVVEAINFNEIKTYFLVALLVSLGTGYQIANANFYKNLWSMQKQFLWQLVWRIPSIEPGTIFLAYQLPEIDYWTGHGIASFMNWTYSEEVVDRGVNYYFVIINRGEKNYKLDTPPNLPIDVSFRSYEFKGNTSQLVFLHYTKDGCVRILDEKITPPQTVMIDFYQSKATQLTNLSKIAHLTNLNLVREGKQSHPPLHILGNEPVKSWCYYFEKAEFARQVQDFSQVISLYNEATRNNLSPLNSTEYYPFIDSYAHTGNWVMAKDLTENLSLVSKPELRAGLCHIWQGLQTDFPGQEEPATILAGLDCSQLE